MTCCSKVLLNTTVVHLLSFVVLMGRKDRTWRLCTNYGKLNQKTVKDKFPILIIDDLLDELTRAVMFSKIDLRYGYHS